MHRDCLRAEARSHFKGGVHNGNNEVSEGGGAPGIGLTIERGGGGASSSEDFERSMTA